MATQVVTITAIILGIRFAPLETLGQWALWLTVVLALVSAVEYFRRFWVQMDVATVRAAGRHRDVVPPDGIGERAKRFSEELSAGEEMRRPLLDFSEPPVLIPQRRDEGPKRDVPTHR